MSVMAISECKNLLGMSPGGINDDYEVRVSSAVDNVSCRMPDSAGALSGILMLSIGRVIRLYIDCAA